MSSLGSLITSLGADLGPLNRSVNSSNASFNKYQRTGQSALNKVKKSVFSLKGAFVGLSTAMAVKGTFTALKSYETALTDMGKVTDEAFDTIAKRMKKLPATLGTTTQLLGGYYETMSAGVTDLAESQSLLVAASKTAKIAHIDQGTSVKAMAVLYQAYGDEINSAMDSANLLLTIEAKGITKTGELAGTIGTVANLAHESGLSFDEMGASIAQISKTGVGTAETITQLRSLLTSLTKNFDKLPPSIQKYGTATDAIKDLGFQGVLKEIIEATDGNATTLVKMLGRQEAYLALIQLSKTNGMEYAEVLEAMKNKTTALDDAWIDYKNSLGGIWDTLKNIGMNLLIKLGSEVLPAIKTSLGFVIDNVDTLKTGVIALMKVGVTAWLVHLTVITLPLLATAVGAVIFEFQFLQLLVAEMGLATVIKTQLILPLFRVKVAALAAKGAIGLITIAAGILIAAYAGFKLGQWLYDNFEWARKSGVHMVSALFKSWKWLENAFKKSMVFLVTVWKKMVIDLRNPFDAFLIHVANGMDKIPGMSGVAKAIRVGASEYLAELDLLKTGTAAKVAAIDSTYTTWKTSHKALIDSLIADAIRYDKNAVKVPSAITPPPSPNIPDPNKKVTDLGGGDFAGGDFAGGGLMWEIPEDFGFTMSEMVSDAQLMLIDANAAIAENTKMELSSMQEAWSDYLSNTSSALDQVSQLSVSVAEQMAAGIGSAFAGVIVYGESMRDAFANVMKSVAAQIISSLISIGVQKAIQWAMSRILDVGEASSRMSILSAETYAGAFAATVPIPIIGPAMAPIVAAGSLSAMLTGATGAAATGAGVGAMIGLPKAGGGPVSAGVSYPVGERGVEMFTPNVSGMITPNNKLGGSVGDVYVSVSFPEITDVDALYHLDEQLFADRIAATMAAGVRKGIYTGLEVA